MSGAATAASPRYRGRIDRLEPDHLAGWALVENSGARAELEITLDGELLGVAVADQPRDDLKAAGIGDGCHGFRFAAPDGVTLKREGLSVLFRNTGVPLRPPASSGGGADPVTGKLAELTEAVQLLGQMTRQKSASVTPMPQGLATAKGQDEVLEGLRRIETLISVGFAQSLREHVAGETTENVDARLRGRFRLLVVLNVLLLGTTLATAGLVLLTLP